MIYFEFLEATDNAPITIALGEFPVDRLPRIGDILHLKDVRYKVTNVGLGAAKGGNSGTVIVKPA